MNEGRDDSCGGRARLASTAGYASDAERLASQYESVTFDRVHGAVLPYLDVAPCRAADIGAGTGRDAAALSARGHRVTAVEPVAELRAIGQRLHPDAGIGWLDDALPDLLELEGPFGLVLITAVWMHLDAEERGRGVRRVAGCSTVHPRRTCHLGDIMTRVRDHMRDQPPRSCRPGPNRPAPTGGGRWVGGRRVRRTRVGTGLSATPPANGAALPIASPIGAPTPLGTISARPGARALRGAE
jgi:SAM-dependent methyltransferase